MKQFLMVFALSMVVLAPLSDARPEALKPGPHEKCAVCGMLVAGYPAWVAAIEFKDGTRVYFDGPKDVFNYYLDVERFSGSKRHQADIRDILVTDYYSLSVIDGRKAFYVTGSDVLGPMGRELVPFGSEMDAKEFMRDHKGKEIVRFENVNQGHLRGLMQMH